MSQLIDITPKQPIRDTQPALKARLAKVELARQQRALRVARGRSTMLQRIAARRGQMVVCRTHHQPRAAHTIVSSNSGSGSSSGSVEAGSAEGN